MAKSILTFEVDHGQMFDMVAAIEGHDKFGPIGGRLASAFLAPRDLSMAESLGMAVYGITLVSVEPAAPIPADQTTGGRS